MNKIMFIFMALIVSTSFVHSGGKQEYPGADTYSFNIRDFTGINGSSSFDIEVKMSDKYSVEIIADKSLKSKLIVEKRGDELYLGMKPFSPFNIKSPRALITMPVLETVQLSGASSMVAAGFKSSREFRCHLSGASSLDIDITCGDIYMELSGASDATFVLEAAMVTLELSGSSDIELYGYGSDLFADFAGASSADLNNFSVKNASLELSGSSDIHIKMNGKLNIDASGASNMYYTGNVIMGDIELSGASSIQEE